MTRRDFLRASATCGLTSISTAAQERPNIVVVLCDDLGYSDLGCFGNRVIRTPQLDRLAAAGTRFTSFYSVSPVCSPSRTALMTGRYPQRFGIDHADLPEVLPRYYLPPSAVTVGKVFKAGGYYTAHIGKWHLGEPPHTVMPREQGFDYFFGSFGGRPSSPWIKYARSMDPEMIENESRPKVVKGHVTEVLTDAALKVLDQAPRDRPFYLNLWHNAPHEPLAPLINQKESYRDWSPEEQTYFQTVTGMDRGVGRLLDKLEQMGAARRTLVLFTSDNGPETHSAKYSRGSAWPLKGMKTQLWEGGIRVPSILTWPGRVPAGRTVTVPAGMLDAFPTFCAAAGVAAPAGLDSRVDLVALANGDRSRADRPLFFEFHFPQRGIAASLPMAVRHGRWKLFSDHEYTRAELYDLESDPGEQRNIAPESPQVVARLLAQIKSWWKQFEGIENLHPQQTRVPVPTPEELEKKQYRN